ncbi:MAG: type II secretion system protein [Gammaproteobacteria bacterium]|nr:MAG: type II secretion system protein [Gammaproteobacteria bacterium]
MLNNKTMVKSSGFTLIEIALVLIIMASLAVLTSKFFFRDLDAQTVDQTADEIALIQRAALTYFARNKEWPDQSGGCADAAEEMGDKLLAGLNLATTGAGASLTVNGIYSPWYGPSGKVSYTTSCTNGASMSVSVQLDNQDLKYLERMLIKIPLSRKSGSDTVVATVVASSSLAAMENYLKRVEVTKTAGQMNLNTVDAGFNINGRLVDFEVGSCIEDDRRSSGACRHGHRTVAKAIFQLDPDNTSTLGGLTLIPPHSALPGYSDYTLNLCDSGVVSDPNHLFPDTIDCSVGDVRNPDWSIKTNDVFLRGDIGAVTGYDASGNPIVDTTINPDGKYMSEMIPGLRKWIHIKHHTNKKDGDKVKRPKCKYKPDANGVWGDYEPVIIIRPNYYLAQDFSDYISYVAKLKWADWSISQQRYKKWTIDIDKDSAYSYVTEDEYYVTADTYCVTSTLHTENKDDGDDDND